MGLLFPGRLTRSAIYGSQIVDSHKGQIVSLIICPDVQGTFLNEYRPYAHDVISVRRPHIEVKTRLFIGQSMCVLIVSSPFDLKDGGWMTSMHKVYWIDLTMMTIQC